MTKLLLLALLGLLPLAAAAQNLPAAATQPGVSDRSLLAENIPTEMAQVPSERANNHRLSEDDDVCYRIRAYIFKRDDDHAPKLVGSTTCGPRQPRARSAAAPQAHFETLK